MSERFRLSKPFAIALGLVKIGVQSLPERPAPLTISA
jgi:hypothetical protein